MSEFECKQGHLMSCRDDRCKICGSPVWRMDGLTAREHEARDRYYEEQTRDEDEFNWQP